MAKLILISILIATVWVPLHASKSPSAIVGLRRMVVALFLFEAIYLVLMVFVYPRL